MSTLRKVMGIHSCHETFKVRPQKIEKVWIRDTWKDSKELSDFYNLTKSLKIKIDPVGVGFLDKWGRGHQGIGIEVSESPVFDYQALKKKENALLLALDGIEDPQNLGAIIRSAWLMGVNGILTTKSHSSPLSPTVNKVASGGVEHVPIEVESSLSSALKSLKDQDFWIFGLTSTAPQVIWNSKIPAKLVLVLGSEGGGLKKPILSMCDEIFRLKQITEQASLNVSVAAACAMNEVFRQWEI